MKCDSVLSGMYLQRVRIDLAWVPGWMYMVWYILTVLGWMSDTENPSVLIPERRVESVRRMNSWLISIDIQFCCPIVSSRMIGFCHA